MRQLIFFLIGVAFLAPGTGYAQAVLDQKVDTLKGEVVEIVSEGEREIVGTGTVAPVQTIRVRQLDGERAGEIVEFENDMVMLEEGERIFFNRMETINGDVLYMLKDVDRRIELLTLGILFVVLLVWFAGRQGVRALLSLAASIGAIVFVLVPALLAGYDPILTSIGIAAIILALVLFGTHGFRPHSFLAFGGTITAVLFTGLIATVFVSAMRLTGFGSDASVYLNFATHGQLDFAGLLLGSIIIGILGVLDDVSITQAAVVEELKSANRSFGFVELYQRAIRVGRDHVGSLVNTLALAYIGVSLPLVLFLSGSEAPITHLLNQEIVAAELVRIIVGSIGLVMAVPFTTALAAWWYDRHEAPEGTRSDGHHHHHH